MILDPQRVRELTRRPTPTPAPLPPTRPRVRPTPEIAAHRRERIRTLHAANVSTAQIVREIGISRTAVRRYLSDPPGSRKPAHLKCPTCGHRGWCEVTETRGTASGITRRRECECGARFSTVETVV